MTDRLMRSSSVRGCFFVIKSGYLTPLFESKYRKSLFLQYKGASSNRTVKKKCSEHFDLERQRRVVVYCDCFSFPTHDSTVSSGKDVFICLPRSKVWKTLLLSLFDGEGTSSSHNTFRAHCMFLFVWALVASPAPTNGPRVWRLKTSCIIASGSLDLRPWNCCVGPFLLFVRPEVKAYTALMPWKPLCVMSNTSTTQMSVRKKELNTFCSSSCGEISSADEVLWPRQYRFDVLILFSAAPFPQLMYISSINTSFLFWELRESFHGNHICLIT